MEIDGFSWVKIPFTLAADYAIVKKEGEETYRIINSVGKISKPFTGIYQIAEAGLTLVEDADPENHIGL